MEKTKEYDVLIIGAGPIGLVCGIEAKRRNLESITIEKGCLVNSIFNYPLNMTFFSSSDRLEIGDVPFITYGHMPTRREALEYFRRVKQHWDLNIRTYEKVLTITDHNQGYQITTTKNNYSARSVIIATGYYDNPNMLHIAGEDLDKVSHYYDDPYRYVDQKVAVIGAGNSAIDAALEIYRIGGHVQMVIKESEIKSTVKAWIKPDIENRIKEGSIAAFFNSSVQSIDKNSITVQTPQKIITLENDFVLALIGYHPDYNFLEKNGIQITVNDCKLPVCDPDTLETNKNNIFIAGVICGGMDTARWTIENSREHAIKIFDHLSKK